MILVTGATGKVGRRVVAGLLAAGAGVRALVRTPAAANLPPEVEVVAGDLTDPAAVGEAAAGAEAAFLLWPSFDSAGAEPVVYALVEQVRRVVYLSALNPAGVWGEVEQLLIAAGAKATFLRAGGFAANTLTWADGIRAGELHLPSPHAGRSLVHEQDLADVAVVCLLDPLHAGHAYDLTGPEVLTQEQQVAVLADVAGHPVRIVEQSPAEARAGLLALGFDETLADASVAYWASLVDHPEPVTPDVEALTGHPARPFRTWAEQHAELFR